MSVIHAPRAWCAIAGLHASLELERGGAPCQCEHCERECDCPDVNPLCNTKPEPACQASENQNSKTNPGDEAAKRDNLRQSWAEHEAASKQTIIFLWSGGWGCCEVHNGDVQGSIRYWLQKSPGIHRHHMERILVIDSASPDYCDIIKELEQEEYNYQAKMRRQEEYQEYLRLKEQFEPNNKDGAKL